MIKFGLFESEEKKLVRRSKRVLREHKKGKEYHKLFKILASFNYSLVKDFSYEKSSDQETIKYLASRSFNFAIQSYRSALSGYYQVSFSLMRDLVETDFLLDYFSSNPEKINEWTKLDNQQRKKSFSPSVLYKFLDDRDGFKTGQRKRQYQMFCEYASHPTYPGFILMSNSSKLIETGFFYDEKKLLNAMHELVKRYSKIMLILPKFLPSNNNLENIDLYRKLLDQFEKVLGTKVTEKSSKKMISLLKKQKKEIKKRSTR